MKYAKNSIFHGLTGVGTWQFEVLTSMSVSKKILLLRFNIITINSIWKYYVQIEQV